MRPWPALLVAASFAVAGCGGDDAVPAAAPESSVTSAPDEVVSVGVERSRLFEQLVSARCDTHALIESKKTSTFTLSVVVDGEAPASLEIVPEDGPARAALQQAVEDCLAVGPAG